MPTPPALTAEQRRQAYEKALALRQERAMLKEAVRFGAVALQDAWRYEAARGMRAYDLLVCVPTVGKARALRMLNQASIPERNSVRQCGTRQVERLFILVQSVYDRRHGDTHRAHG